jgi:phosphopantothenoylcysteine decarboxylase
MKDHHKVFICIGMLAIAGLLRRKKFQQRLLDEASTALARKRKKAPKQDGKRRRVLLIATGSVASVKIPSLVQQLVQKEVFVDLVLTEASYKFLKNVEYNGFKGMQLLKSISILRSVDGTRFLEIYGDKHEWESYSEVGNDVLHISLVKRNSLLVVAPLSADTLAKFALGLASNLATSVLRAWYYDLEEAFASPIAEKYGVHVINKPVLVAPAMNTFMYYQKITQQHLTTLKNRSVVVIPPISKTLACGDTGVGAMAEVSTLVGAIVEQLDLYEAACLEAKSNGLPEFLP